MLIKIKFSDSNIDNMYSEDYKEIKCVENIPTKDIVNIFTREELDRLQSILDHNLECSMIRLCDLENGNLGFNKPYPWANSDDEEKQVKNDEYEDIYYNKSETLPLYIVSGYNSNFIVDSDLLFSFMSDYNSTGATLSYEVTGTIKDVPSLKSNKESKVLDKLLSLETSLNNFSKTQQFNTKVGVHVSDLGLLNVKEVDVLLDICTDELQEWLNKGWRILSICPQPDQRRPDYVVGRNTPINGRQRRKID